MFAHVVRYEVGREENAEAFVDEVLSRFDAMQDELPGMIGSLLLTRGEDGEALQLVFFENEEAAGEAEPWLRQQPAPDAGAREVVTGRRPDALGRPVWKAWQGRWDVKTDRSDAPAARSIH